MTPFDPPPLTIRNRRYPRWFDMLGGMMVGLMAFGAVGAFFTPGTRFDKVMACAVLGGFLGVGVLALYGWVQIRELRHPVPRRPLTPRTAFERLVLGIRRTEPGPADGRTVLAKRYLVHHLKLGNEVEVDHPVVRYPVRGVRQVRFAPNPKEDYAGAERPMRLCQAVVAMDSGREFALMIDPTDARRLRAWADAKGIPVSDADGYRPPTAEPRPGVPVHE